MKHEDMDIDWRHSRIKCVLLFLSTLPLLELHDVVRRLVTVLYEAEALERQKRRDE